MLEIGTGWGGFAVHAAATRGCRVITTTISREQHDYAVERVRRAGLEDRVTVLMRDYRDLRGTLRQARLDRDDRGGRLAAHRAFFARCSDLLTPHGAMLLQAITIDDRAYEVEKASQVLHPRVHLPRRLPALAGGDHAQRRAAHRSAGGGAGGHHRQLRRDAAPLARTTSPPTARSSRELGYDERFQRLWTLYLAYCEGGFAERRICDVQLLLAKPRWAVKAGAAVRSSAIAVAAAPNLLIGSTAADFRPDVSYLTSRRSPLGRSRTPSWPPARRHRWRCG